MRIIYRAFPETGAEKDFDSIEACKAYEEENRPRIWDMGGKETDDGEVAYFVYIPENQAEMLFDLYGEDNFAGIDRCDEGFFYWDDFDERFHYLDKDVILRVERFIRDNPFFKEHKYC